MTARVRTLVSVVPRNLTAVAEGTAGSCKRSTKATAVALGKCASPMSRWIPLWAGPTRPGLENNAHDGSTVSEYTASELCVRMGRAWGHTRARSEGDAARDNTRHGAGGVWNG